MKRHSDYDNLFVVDHPLVQHSINLMRSKDCPHFQYRACMKQISTLMAYEAVRVMPLPVRREEIDTHTSSGRTFQFIASEHIALIAVMRAAIIMAATIHELFPGAPFGHVGIVRDPNGKTPNRYYQNLPPLDRKLCLVLDPVIATGATMCALLREILDEMNDVDANLSRVCVISALSSHEGITRIQREFPAKDHEGFTIVTASIEEALDIKNRLVPGIGDAGDRLYKTEGSLPEYPHHEEIRHD